jgi:hypothetical protein
MFLAASDDDGVGVVLPVVKEGLVVLQEMNEVLMSDDRVLAELLFLPGKGEERYSDRTAGLMGEK